MLKDSASPTSKWGPANECDRIGTRYDKVSSVPMADNRAESSSGSSSETGKLLSNGSLLDYDEAVKL